ncbi:hypothetical protein F3I52_09425 [Pantoea sp. M_8]|nr:hypothetical protein F3I51_10170 [Pantoea sp. M_6]KAA5977298.1 hypothetical protein F3I52_09425 [Pantoea sp. M_8]KAA5990500.1 hypothetical protein F3I50_23900 [Pantoea sp. M_5]KAA5993492.1 hypothetical protein F3I47_00310 [Pantoea sp. M_10]
MQIVKIRKFFDAIYRPDTLAFCLLLRSVGLQPTFMDRHRRRLICSLRLLARHLSPDGVFSVFPTNRMSRLAAPTATGLLFSLFRSHK